MGHRLSKIVTRTGDAGTTGLGDGSRTDKDSARIEAIGTIDELNSAIGMLLAEGVPDKAKAALTEVQHDLFDLGGELSVPGLAGLDDGQVARLEALVEDFNSTLAPLKEFVLPGGCRPAAVAHLCRTVCRRAERRLVSLSKTESVRPLVLQYVNRLSDLLFVLARVLNRESGAGDVLWHPARNRGK